MEYWSVGMRIGAIKNLEFGMRILDFDALKPSSEFGRLEEDWSVGSVGGMRYRIMKGLWEPPSNSYNLITSVPI